MSLNSGQFPFVQMRRRRSQPWLREMMAETSLNVNDLVWPVFVREGQGQSISVASLPGVASVSVDILIEQVQEAKLLGIPAVALFPVVDSALKTENAQEAYNEHNLICRTIRALKQNVEGIGIICDVALDPYTTHGHDGILVDGKVHNQTTIELLCKQSLTLAKAGADVIAPSDMMDGRIGVIRQALDKANFDSVLLLSYAVKYASHLYGPFRQAVGSAQEKGKVDKRTYQMDFRNAKEALQEVWLDINEGADAVMVKPAMLYMDVIRTLKEQITLPIFAYQVSGEYAMIKAAGQNGWLDDEAVLFESLLGLKRAGATGIFTYAAVEIAKKLKLYCS